MENTAKILRPFFAQSLRAARSGGDIRVTPPEVRRHYLRSSSAHAGWAQMSAADGVLCHAARCGLAGPVGRLP